MREVLDSSVLVAALRSRRGASFRLLQLLRANRFEIAISVPLALEYEMVLIRHSKDLDLAVEDAIAIVDYLCEAGHKQDIHFLWRPSLNDPRDECILELAVAARCRAIVTHSVRDFGGAARFGIAVHTPGEFLRFV